MIKSNRLAEMAMVVGDSVGESAFVDWNSSGIWPVDLLSGQCAFIIWKQTSNQKQLELIEQNYLSEIEVTADILFLWRQYDRDMNFSRDNSVYENMKIISDNVITIDGFHYSDWNMERESLDLPAFHIASVFRNHTKRINTGCNNSGLYTRLDSYDCYSLFRHDHSTSDIDSLNEQIVHKMRQIYSGQTFDFDKFMISDFELVERIPVPPNDDVIMFNFKIITENHLVDYDNDTSILGKVYQAIQNHSLYTSAYKEISILSDRVYYDRPQERFGTTVNIKYSFLDDLFDSDDTKVKWNLLGKNWDQYSKRYGAF